MEDYHVQIKDYLTIPESLMSAIRLGGFNTRNFFLQQEIRLPLELLKSLAASLRKHALAGPRRQSLWCNCMHSRYMTHTHMQMACKWHANGFGRHMHTLKSEDND